MAMVYKVVYKNKKGERFSVWVKARIAPLWEELGRKVSSTLLKKYSVEEWTTASPSLLKLGYGLCVFPDHFRAVRFKGEHFFRTKGVQIWEAETSELFNPPPLQLYLEYRQFKMKLTTVFSDFPEGTMMCNRVRLIKEVT